MRYTLSVMGSRVGLMNVVQSLMWANVEITFRPLEDGDGIIVTEAISDETAHKFRDIINLLPYELSFKLDVIGIPAFSNISTSHLAVDTSESDINEIISIPDGPGSHTNENKAKIFDTLNDIIIRLFVSKGWEFDFLRPLMVLVKGSSSISMELKEHGLYGYDINFEIKDRDGNDPADIYLQLPPFIKEVKSIAGMRSCVFENGHRPSFAKIADVFDGHEIHAPQSRIFGAIVAHIR